MMKRLFKKNNENGFTLAELLIVVAIIAVLVAISIPIFTTQLEKAREATDAANIRAAYAEVMSAGITGDTANYQKEVKIKQHVAAWSSSIEWPAEIADQAGKPVTVGGIATITFVPKTGGVDGGDVSIIYGNSNADAN